jgi:hypothetical protein
LREYEKGGKHRQKVAEIDLKGELVLAKNAKRER